MECIKNLLITTSDNEKIRIKDVTTIFVGPMSSDKFDKHCHLFFTAPYGDIRIPLENITAISYEIVVDGNSFTLFIDSHLKNNEI